MFSHLNFSKALHCKCSGIIAILIVTTIVGIILAILVTITKSMMSQIYIQDWFH